MNNARHPISKAELPGYRQLAGLPQIAMADHPECPEQPRRIEKQCYCLTCEAGPEAYICGVGVALFTAFECERAGAESFLTLSKIEWARVHARLEGVKTKRRVVCGARARKGAPGRIKS